MRSLFSRIGAAFSGSGAVEPVSNLPDSGLLLESARIKRRPKLLQDECRAISEQETRNAARTQSKVPKARVEDRYREAAVRIDELVEAQQPIVMNAFSEAIARRVDVQQAIEMAADGEVYRISELLEADRQKVEWKWWDEAVQSARRGVREDNAQVYINRMLVEQEEFPPILEFIKLHANTLLRKYRNAQRVDEYGLTVFNEDTWFADLEDFLGRVLVTRFGPELVTRHRDLILKTIDSELLMAQARLAVAQSDGAEVTADTEGRDYEEICAALLIKAGWRVSLTPATGDQGVDLLAEKNGVVCAIQCKRWKGTVGNGAVQEVAAGRKHFGAHYAAVVTSSSYTPSARAVATSNFVALLHHDDLHEFDAVIASMSRSH